MTAKIKGETMKSLEELQQIREKTKARFENEIRVTVGMATCGIAAGAKPVLAALLSEIEKRELKNVTVSQTGCIGMCKYEPMVEIFSPDGQRVTYISMTEQKAREIVASHLIFGKPIAEYMFK